MTLLPLSHPLLNYDGNPKAARTLLES
ncbi:MAG: hypothetical protein ACI84E_002086, partial [Planctomycetota bacterium]